MEFHHSINLSSKPDYEMLECYPDWIPSLHLRHTDIKEMMMMHQQRSEMDDAAPSDEASQRSEMDDAAPKDDIGEQHN
ncbi:hypothetical protein AMELA_G00070510 [Ameiurus melas]|uniref:Uncharacterized protein n=1 Tax=Ameiurus melas TaxID=219545 RepID=A0A7J6B3R1_AMEME|nr:hypothetical protein AMELA_G00070510 [Ameiurus melas]